MDISKLTGPNAEVNQEKAVFVDQDRTAAVIEVEKDQSEREDPILEANDRDRTGQVPNDTLLHGLETNVFSTNNPARPEQLDWVFEQHPSAKSNEDTDAAGGVTGQITSPHGSQLKKTNFLKRIEVRVDAWVNRPIAPRFWGPRHMDHLARKLEHLGIRSFITSYGGARTKPPEVALTRYRDALDEFNRHVDSPNAAEYLKAREAVQESAIVLNESKYYAMLRELSGIIDAETGGMTALASGGGPGAAMQGFFERFKGVRIGLNIHLPHEQHVNPYVIHTQTYHRFDDRQADLREYSGVWLFSPGGFGTIYELSENLTLTQLNKTHPWRPDQPKPLIILLGSKEDWNHSIDPQWLYDHRRISKSDLELFHYAETAKEAWQLMASTIKKLNATPRSQPSPLEHWMQVVKWQLKKLLG